MYWRSHKMRHPSQAHESDRRKLTGNGLDLLRWIRTWSRRHVCDVSQGNRLDYDTVSVTASMFRFEHLRPSIYVKLLEFKHECRGVFLQDDGPVRNLYSKRMNVPSPCRAAQYSDIQVELPNGYDERGFAIVLCWRFHTSFRMPPLITAKD